MTLTNGEDINHLLGKSTTYIFRTNQFYQRLKYNICLYNIHLSCQVPNFKRIQMLKPPNKELS